MENVWQFLAKADNKTKNIFRKGKKEKKEKKNLIKVNGRKEKNRTNKTVGKMMKTITFKCIGNHNLYK